MMHDNEQIERKDDGSDRLAALYGLTPKVETAIIEAVQAGAVRRIVHLLRRFIQRIKPIF